MMLIILHHNMLYFGDLRYPNMEQYIIGTDVYVDSMLNSIGIIGVNLFVLISGWFGIKSVKRSLLRLFVTFLWCAVFVTSMLSFSTFYYFDFRHWWFIENFIVLILLSPIIEKSLENVSFKTHTFWIICLTVANVLFGWLWGLVNTNGYNYINFIYLYYMGRWARELMSRPVFIKVSFVRGLALLLFMLSIFISVLIYAKYVQFTEITSIKWWSYNSPAVLLSSFCVFILFSTINLKYNKYINFIATGTLAAYIIHTKDFFYQTVMYRIGDIFSNYSYLGVLFFVIAILLGLYTVSAPIEFIISKLRKRFTSQ